MNRVTGPGLPGSTGQNHGAWSAYAANSDLIGQTQFKDESATVVASASRTYHGYRDLVTTLENKWGDTYVISKYDYAYDALGRPKHVSNSGEAFDAYSQDAHSQYGYDDRSELTASDRYEGVYADPPGPAVSDETFGYVYDNAGNRTDYDIGTPPPPETTDYYAIALNQYTRTDYDGRGADARQSLAYDAALDSAARRQGQASNLDTIYITGDMTP